MTLHYIILYFTILYYIVWYYTTLNYSVILFFVCNFCMFLQGWPGLGRCQVTMWLACVTAMASWSGSLSPDSQVVFPSAGTGFFWSLGVPLRSHWLDPSHLGPKAPSTLGCLNVDVAWLCRYACYCSGFRDFYRIFFFSGAFTVRNECWTLPIGTFAVSLFWQLINVVWCTLVIILLHIISQQ